MTSNFVTTDEAAALMVCSSQAARDRIRRGGLKPKAKCGRHLLYDRAEVEALHQSHHIPPQIDTGPPAPSIVDFAEAAALVRMYAKSQGLTTLTAASDMIEFGYVVVGNHGFVLSDKGKQHLVEMRAGR